MEIRRGFIDLLFDAATMRRWNDKIRPVDLRELDKQAHKAVVAYVLGKIQEGVQGDFSWDDLLMGFVYEFIQRTTVTDLKPQLFREIERKPEAYRKLNAWVLKERRSQLKGLGDHFSEGFARYFTDDSSTSARRVLHAAHFYTTRWEFEILRRANPDGFEMHEIHTRIRDNLESLSSLHCHAQFEARPKLQDFVDLCGQLRFQLRWGGLQMIPQVSVLGHMLMVAIVAYLMSKATGACPARCYNNFFTGLFHDLPEVLTKDVISPVKRSSSDMQDIIKEFENSQMESVVKKLLPSDWYEEITLFTHDEFANVIYVQGRWQRVRSARIARRYNTDEHRPRDGTLIKALDSVLLFSEAYHAKRNGSTDGDLTKTMEKVRNRYSGSKGSVSGIDIESLLAEFD